jgi:hypothetical protein
VNLARRAVLLLALLVAFSAAFGAWDFFMKQKGHIDDDDFYFLYGTTGALTSPHRYRHLSTLFIAAERLQGYPEELARNLELKRDYAFNYVLASAVYYVTAVVPSHVRRWARFGTTDLPLNPMVLREGFMMAFLLAFGAVCWLVWRSGDLNLALAFTATVVLCAYWAATWDEAGDQRFVYIFMKYPAQLQRHLTNFFINPRWYSFLHNSPRSTFVIVLIGVFVLRWSGRLAESYAWLIAAILTHGSNGLMMTASIVGIDAVSNCEFYTRRVLLLATVAAVLAAATESIWPSVLFRAGFSARGAAVLVLLLAGAALLWYSTRTAAQPTDRGPRTYLARVAIRLEAMGRPSLDVMLLTAGWIALFVISVAVTRGATGYQQLYFFDQANGRMLAVLQPVVIMGVFFTLLRLVIRRPDSRAALVAAALMVIAMSPVAAAVLTRGLEVPDKLMPDMMRRVPELEAQVQAPPLANRNREMSSDDLTLYVDYRFFYALARSLDSGIDYVSPLVSAPPDGGRVSR